MSPKPPYYVVIFTSRRNNDAEDLYTTTSQEMFALAAKQPGYLGVESARDSSHQGITVTYWDSLDNIKRWKTHAEHLIVQKLGREVFYEEYHVRVAKVEREYCWTKADKAAGAEQDAQNR
jgi:heme-degrading monooxygenase HmoA